ncbi:hypothetical protein CR513_47170, partial [Mucuna pruriens]
LLQQVSSPRGGNFSGARFPLSTSTTAILSIKTTKKTVPALFIRYLHLSSPAIWTNPSKDSASHVGLLFVMPPRRHLAILLYGCPSLQDFEMKNL